MRRVVGAVLALLTAPSVASAAGFSLYEYPTNGPVHPSVTVTRNLPYGVNVNLQFNTRYYEIVADSGVRIRNSFAGQAADVTDACARPYVPFGRQVGIDPTGATRPVVVATTADALCAGAYIAPLGSATTTAAGTTSATANTFTTALAANANRRDCTIYSPVAFSIALGVAPTAATAIAVGAGGTFKCGAASGVVATDQVNIASATASAAYVVWSQ